MANETALWGRLKKGAAALRGLGHLVDVQRLENAVAVGHPDVEGCIDGRQIWIENKSELRKKRSTLVRPKLRESQSIWHKERVAAGCRFNWVLIQVGEDHGALLYLVPGCYYDRLAAIEESDLERLSVVKPAATPADVLLTAAGGW